VRPSFLNFDLLNIISLAKARSLSQAEKEVRRFAKPIHLKFRISNKEFRTAIAYSIFCGSKVHLLSSLDIGYFKQVSGKGLYPCDAKRCLFSTLIRIISRIFSKQFPTRRFCRWAMTNSRCPADTAQLKMKRALRKQNPPGTLNPETKRINNELRLAAVS
jgi:hypothetical protein